MWTRAGRTGATTGVRAGGGSSPTFLTIYTYERQAAWITAGGVEVCNRRGWRSRPAAPAFALLFTMGGQTGRGMLAVGTVLVVSVLVHRWSCTRGVEKGTSISPSLRVFGVNMVCEALTIFLNAASSRKN